MSERNRNSIVVTWIAVAFVFAAIISLITWDSATYLAEERVRAEKTAEYHDAYAEDRIDKECLSLDPIPMRDCIHEEIEAARDHERSEQDLDAQQAMAHFTRVMGYTAILGLLMGAVSIGLIFATLRATQVMAKDTREIGSSQLRPYVFCRAVTFSEAFNPLPIFDVYNAGQTPANLVKIDYDFIHFSDGEITNAEIPKGGFNLIGDIFSNSSIPTKSGMDLWVGAGKKVDVAHIRGVVTYYDPIHKRNEVSPFLFISKRYTQEFTAHSPDGIDKYNG